jgi:hypothetical protein
MDIAMNSIKFINHSSVLINDNNNFILTDPWFEKPAFGSWLPTPPCSVHPAYLVALSNTVENFILAISHGHDDHLDDELLSLFPKNLNVVIPRYRSKGLVKRLNKIGFTNIHEVDETGYNLSEFIFKSYINPTICPDDAIITIQTKNSFIVHANDNWQKIQPAPLKKIINDSKKYPLEKRIYMSQCNLADGWPDIYKDYTTLEKKAIHNSRILNIIQTTLNNANLIGCRNFLNYAGHASAFVKGNEKMKDMTSYVPNKVVKKILNDLKIDINILDMMPGDSFNFERVIKQFGDINLNDLKLKQASWDFYKKQQIVSKCDTYQNIKMDTFPFEEKINYFLNGFNNFVMKRVEATGFNSDIVGFKIKIRSDKHCGSVVIGGSKNFSNKVASFYIPDEMLWKLLSGKIIWENLYIGFQCEVETFPIKTNIRAPIRWLASYGYVYQIRCRSNER